MKKKNRKEKINEENEIRWIKREKKMNKERWMK